MRTVAGFQRQGSFPTKERPLGQALALLEQRAADRFDALAQNGGDVVGSWIRLDGLGLDPSTLGNGRITGQWRQVGLGNAGFRLLIEVGTTTVFSGFGFELRPPPKHIYDVDTTLFPLKGNTNFPVPIGGIIAGVNTGATMTALLTSSGIVFVLGAVLATLVAGDQIMLDLELPVKRAS